MRQGFYRAVVLLGFGLAAACSDSGAAGAPVAGAEARVFQSRGAQAVYEPPADGDLLPRYLGHLERATRDGLRFALARLGEMGAESAPAIADAIRARLRSDMEFAVVANLCDALGRTGHAPSAGVLLELLRLSEVPVVRSSAADAIGQLGNAELVPGVIEAIERETEPGPLLRLYAALGSLGGPEAAAYLEGQVLRWLAGDPALARVGPVAWSAILGFEDADADARVARLSGDMAPAFRVPALSRRVELGARGLEPELRLYLDSTSFPSASVRSQAAQGLAKAGDWEGVLLALQDPSPAVVVAAIQGLRLPAAVEVDAGRAELEERARSEDDQIALPALQALVERGDRRGLEPWMRLAREYPTGARSAEALHVLSYEGMADERVPPLLMRRWDLCELDQRLDVLRVLGRIGAADSMEFLEELLEDPETHPDIRVMALTQLGNFGQKAVPVLLRRIEAGVQGDEIAAALAALGRHVEHPDARAFFVRVVGDDSAVDAIRAQSMELLPRLLGGDAYEPLLAARDSTQRGEVRTFLDRILLEFF